MLITYNYLYYISWRRVSRVILIVFWVSGILLGICATDAADSVVVSLMPRFCLISVSIIGILLRNLFFLMITAFAVFLSKPLLLLPAAFIRAFLLSYFLSAIVLAWQGDAWLIVLFSCTSLLSACTFLWFWFHQISRVSVSVKHEFIACVLVLGILGILEYFVTSPLLLSLLD